MLIPRSLARSRRYRNRARALLSAGNFLAFGYTAANRLGTTYGVTAGAIPFAYGTNALEQLVTRAQTGGPMAFTTHFVHDIFGNIIAETAGGGATGSTGSVREYIWLPETEIAPTSGSRTTIDRPLAVVDAVNTASPATYWVTVDHLNRPFRMTNAARASVWDAVWLPWGGVHSITGTASLDARFPGQWFQIETGLHYNWHRSYDPSLGRYTQPDPLGFVDGPSVYGYGRASPVKFSDFDGRSANTPSIPKTIPKPVTGLPGIILGACLLTLEYILERKQRKHNCILQHEEDSRWCDNNFIGYRNAVCHQWAGDNLSLCLKGEPRKRWDEVDPGP